MELVTIFWMHELVDSKEIILIPTETLWWTTYLIESTRGDLTQLSATKPRIWVEIRHDAWSRRSLVRNLSCFYAPDDLLSLLDPQKQWPTSY